jgi:hypothetical protein
MPPYYLREKADESRRRTAYEDGEIAMEVENELHASQPKASANVRCFHLNDATSFGVSLNVRMSQNRNNTVSKCEISRLVEGNLEMIQKVADEG